MLHARPRLGDRCIPCCATNAWRAWSATGNKQAFAPLYERYYQPLYRYCRSIVHDDADAQDALQSTFASAFAALRKAQRDAPLRPWLFRIAHNEAVSVHRAAAGHRRALGRRSEPAAESVEEQAGGARPA